MGDKEELVKMLNAELSKQKAIFEKNAGRAINPDGSEEYWAAKAAFDSADRKIKSLEKELARILTDEEAYDPSIWDRIGHYFDKLVGDDEPKDSVASGVRG
ncbi:MAG: hypothetical protein ACW99U_13380 [Candidatus Thorarchaeota archaeon]|jgi:hypothetical protein